MRMLVATKVKISGSKKKSEQKHIQHFLHKTCNWKFHVVVVQTTAKISTKKCAARTKLFFFC